MLPTNYSDVLRATTCIQYTIFELANTNVDDHQASNQCLEAAEEAHKHLGKLLKEIRKSL